MAQITGKTTLADLRRRVEAAGRARRRARQSGAPVQDVPDRLVESIRQSLRVEGYDVPSNIARAAVERGLKDAGR